MIKQLTYAKFKSDMAQFIPHPINDANLVEYNGTVYNIEYTVHNILCLYSALNEFLEIPVIIIEDEEIADAAQDSYISNINYSKIYGFLLAHSQSSKINSDDSSGLSLMNYEDINSIYMDKETLSTILKNKSLIVTKDMLLESDIYLFDDVRSKDFNEKLGYELYKVILNKITNYKQDFTESFAVDLVEYDVLYRNIILIVDNSILPSDVICNFILNKPASINFLGINFIYQDSSGRNLFYIEELAIIENLKTLYGNLKTSVLFDNIESDTELCELLFKCINNIRAHEIVDVEDMKNLHYKLYDNVTSNSDVIIMSKNHALKYLNTLAPSYGIKTKLTLDEIQAIFNYIGILDLLAIISLTTDVIINCTNDLDQIDFESICADFCDHDSCYATSDNIYFDIYIKNYKSLRKNKLVLTNSVMASSSGLAFALLNIEQSMYQLTDEEKMNLVNDKAVAAAKMSNMQQLPHISCIKYSIIDTISTFFKASESSHGLPDSFSSYIVIDNLPANKYEYLTTLDNKDNNSVRFVDFEYFKGGYKDYDITVCSVVDELLNSYKKMYNKFVEDVDDFFRKNTYSMSDEEIEKHKAELKRSALPSVNNINIYLTKVCLLLSQACLNYKYPLFLKDLIVFKCNGVKYIGIIDVYPTYNVSPVEIGNSCVIYESVNTNVVTSRKNTRGLYEMRNVKGKDGEVHKAPSVTPSVVYLMRQAHKQYYRDIAEKPGNSKSHECSPMEMPASIVLRKTKLSRSGAPINKLFADYLFENYTKDLLDYEISKVLCKNSSANSILNYLAYKIDSGIREHKYDLDDLCKSDSILGDYIRLSSVKEYNNKSKMKLVNEVYKKISVYSLRHSSYNNYIINAYGLKQIPNKYSLSLLKSYVPIDGMIIKS